MVDGEVMNATQTGGSFCPRVTPRPQYPPALRVLKGWIWVHARDAALGCAMCFLFFPAFARAAEAWPQFLESLGGKSEWSERTFYALSVSVAHTAPLVLFNGALYLVMHMNSALSKRCYIPRKAHEVPDAPLWRALWIKLAVSHLLVGPLSSLGLYSLVGMPRASDPLPSYLQVAGLLCLAHSFNDWAFYWTRAPLNPEPARGPPLLRSHSSLPQPLLTDRTFHHPKLYGRFHKQHHMFRGSVGPAAEFAGDLETVRDTARAHTPPLC